MTISHRVSPSSTFWSVPNLSVSNTTKSISLALRAAGYTGHISAADRSGEAHLDAGLAAGLRIMAEAGVVPEEFRLQAELDAARKDYAALTDPQARRAAMARISDLEMRCNMARDARKSFFR